MHLATSEKYDLSAQFQIYIFFARTRWYSVIEMYVTKTVKSSNITGTVVYLPINQSPKIDLLINKLVIYPTGATPENAQHNKKHNRCLVKQ